MFRGASSGRNAAIMSLGSWYVRRLVRKRAAAAVAGLVAGGQLPFTRKKGKRHPFGRLLLVGAVIGGGLAWWWRRGGGDDWGDWEPSDPVAPASTEPESELEADPIAT